MKEQVCNLLALASGLLFGWALLGVLVGTMSMAMGFLVLMGLGWFTKVVYEAGQTVYEEWECPQPCCRQKELEEPTVGRAA